MNKVLLLVLFILSFFSINLHAESAMKTEEAIFAMGCFWSGESAFRNHDTNDLIPGITKIRVGYAGGTAPNPTYENHPGYREAVKINFDPKIISYHDLLNVFWHNLDLFNADGQFCDMGFPYKPAIFYQNEAQKSLAQSEKEALEKKFGREIPTELIAYTTFYDAEAYHQD